MKRKISALTFFFIVVFMVVSVDAQEGRLYGRVREEINKVGIPNLTVKLVSPKHLRKPEKITITDTKGEFRFENIDPGSYLIELFQGITMLYSAVIKIPDKSTIEILLKRMD